MLTIAVLSLIVATAGVTWQIATTKDDEGSQASTGTNSPNITVKENPGNTNINVNVESKKGSVSIPKFEGQIQPLSEKDYAKDGKAFENGKKFNEFMMSHDGKIVYLDVWPYYSDEAFNDSSFSDFNKPKLFTINDVPYDFGIGGAEYIIQSADSDDFFYDGRQSSRRIVGNFKIVGVSGPRQGYMSVVIKPVSIEMAELLKK